MSEFFVELRNAGARIDHPDQDLRFVNRHSRLFEDIRRNYGVVIGHDAAGIDQGKLRSCPLDPAVDSIARDPRLIADNGAPFADQAVEQRGLPHVRAAHDGNEICHSRLHQ